MVAWHKILRSKQSYIPQLILFCLHAAHRDNANYCPIGKVNFLICVFSSLLSYGKATATTRHHPRLPHWLQNPVQGPVAAVIFNKTCTLVPNIEDQWAVIHRTDTELAVTLLPSYFPSIPHSLLWPSWRTQKWVGINKIWNLFVCFHYLWWFVGAANLKPLPQNH